MEEAEFNLGDSGDLDKAGSTHKLTETLARLTQLGYANRLTASTEQIDRLALFVI